MNDVDAWLKPSQAYADECAVISQNIYFTFFATVFICLKLFHRVWSFTLNWCTQVNVRVPSAREYLLFFVKKKNCLQISKMEIEKTRRNHKFYDSNCNNKKKLDSLALPWRTLFNSKCEHFSKILSRSHFSLHVNRNNSKERWIEWLNWTQCQRCFFSVRAKVKCQPKLFGRFS